MRENYAVVDVRAHLGENRNALDVPWAEFVGDRTTERTFVVPTDDPTDAYLQLQAYDVGTYGHDIVINGQSISGFDIPPNDGWQYWVDTLSNVTLTEGTNTIRIRRDTDTRDCFAIGTVVVHWKEPVE